MPGHEAKTACYVRVSSQEQNDDLQRDGLGAWAKAHGVTPTWYADKFSGATMDRPGWTELERNLDAGEIDRIVVWKLDRLGRTATGLLALFETLRLRGIGFVSLTESIDLSTPMGRLVTHILAGVAEWEREIRAERQAAGIQAARDRHGGRCPWGGSKKGVRRLRKEQLRAIRRLAAAGTPKREVARLVGVSPTTVYDVLGDGRK